LEEIMSRLHGLAPAAIFAAALAWSHCAAAQDAPEATTLRPVDVNARPARPVRPRATPRPAPRQATARRPVSAPPTLTTAAPSTAGLNAAPSPLVQRYQLPQTYGGPVIGAGFASNYYNLNQVNLANAFSLKTNTRGNFDWDVVVTRYDYLTDIQRNPFTVAATGTNFIDTGKITRLDGTNWMTADARGIWRPTGPGGPHEVSFGIHGDRYELVNPIYKTPTWFGGPDATSTLYTDSLGKTQTTAVWVQDAWRLAPQLKLTTGGRWEDWRAFDGFNLNTTTASATGAITGTTIVNQPTLSAGRFSPKASLTYEASQEWQLTGSYGVANRFPTVTELYQITTLPGTTVPQNPNPNLRPERALSGELAIERRFADGAKVRLSLFQENTRDMIISQLNVLPNGTSATFVTNVDEVRNRGVELAWQKNNLPIDGMEVFGSVTYVDSIILSDPSFVGTPLVGGATSTAVGKHVPNVPEWRATFGATCRRMRSRSPWSGAIRARSTRRSTTSTRCRTCSRRSIPSSWWTRACNTKRATAAR
jgi:iron complex outermembrane recepter protein